MEWVEKTGKTVSEAKERALDQLGVAESDAEVLVLAEPKVGLFGRTRGEARVRARVRPAEPRPKRTRRPRDRGRGEGARERGARADATRPARGGTATTDGQPGREGAAPSKSSGRRRRRRSSAKRRTQGGGEPSATAVAADTVGGGGRSEKEARARRAPAGEDRDTKEEAVADGITLQEQAAVAKEFIEGLLSRYGLTATVDVRELDEDTVELAAHGDGLGVLVGPRGATLAALQDVTRTVVQKHFPNRTDRILVDVAGYRERRIAALQRFAGQVAAEVLESGAERALEPMSAADRKVVHDTIVSIDGVTSSSQGEEPHRYVVISPSSAS